MKISLRAKILLFTVPPLIALAVGTIWIVNRTISSEVHRNIEDELKRASNLFEDLLETRSEHLAVNGMVIVQDPRFFSVLTLPGSPRDPEFRATVAGVPARIVGWSSGSVPALDMDQSLPDYEI